MSGILFKWNVVYFSINIYTHLLKKTEYGLTLMKKRYIGMIIHAKPARIHWHGECGVTVHSWFLRKRFGTR